MKYEKMVEKFLSFMNLTGNDLEKWLINDKNSVLVYLKNGIGYIFSWKSDDNWSVETVKRRKSNLKNAKNNR